MSKRHLVVLALSVPLSLGPGANAQQTPPPRVVDIAAGDGTNLKATYFASGKPGAGILLLHQCNRQRKVWSNLAQSLAASGFHVLTFDFRGFGESGGKSIDQLSSQEYFQLLGQKFPGDVDSAFNYLVSQPGVTGSIIGAGGASCGVNQAVQLARRHPEVKALALLSEGTDHGGRQFLRQSPNLPLFMAVADNDPDPDVVEIMHWNFSLSPNPANQFVRYSTGGHGVEMFDAHQELPAKLVDWFKANLTEHPRTTAAKSSSHSSPETQFLELLDSPGGIAKAMQRYTETHERDAKTSLFTEGAIFHIAFERFQAGDVKEAVDIMQLDVLAYPNSPNVYDSLAYAYMAEGQKDLARKNAQKALDLLASDSVDSAERRKAIKESAERKLKELGEASN